MSAGLSAQQPAPPPAQGQPAGAPADSAAKPPGYGQWWLKHAREVTPRPTGWLFHVEGQGSFANQTGSISGFEYTLDTLSAQRKGLVTNQVGVSFILQESRSPAGNHKQTSAKVSDMFMVNIARSWDLVTAAIWEKDEPKGVLHRRAVLQGLTRYFTLGDGRSLGLSAAIGYEWEDFENENGEVDQASPVIYLRNIFATPVAKKGLFSHSLEFFYDPHNHNDVRVNWDVSLSYQLTPHISIGPAAKIRYDARPVVQVQSTDTMAMIAVQFR